MNITIQTLQSNKYFYQNKGKIIDGIDLLMIY